MERTTLFDPGTDEWRAFISGAQWSKEDLEKLGKLKPRNKHNPLFNDSAISSIDGAIIHRGST